MADIRTHSFAYPCGVLKRDAEGKWVLVSVDIYSEPAWGLSVVNGDKIFVQLSAHVAGPSFASASLSARKNMERVYPKLQPLFRWLLNG